MTGSGPAAFGGLGTMEEIGILVEKAQVGGPGWRGRGRDEREPAGPSGVLSVRGGPEMGVCKAPAVLCRAAAWMVAGMIKQPGQGRGRGRGRGGVGGAWLQRLGKHSGRGMNLSARTGAPSCPRPAWPLPGGGALSRL